jgi:hypothetical protein
MFGVYIFGCCKVGGSAAALKLVLAIYQDEFFILIACANPTYILLIFVFFFMRQLAAIMFVDMAGFTTLMQENEQLVQRTTSLKTA